MITRIEAYQYRCFEKLDVALNAYQVLAGANGSGKSTLLDIPTLLGDLLRTRMVGAAFLQTQPGHLAPRARYPMELVHNHHGRYFTLVVEARLPERVTRAILELVPARVEVDERQWPTALRYELQFEVFNEINLHIVGEHFILFSDHEGFRFEHGAGLVGDTEFPKNRIWHRVIDRRGGEPSIFTPEFRSRKLKLEFRLEPQQIALANVPADPSQFPAVSWFRNFLLDECRMYEPDWEKMRQAASPGLGDRLRTDGQNLPWLLQTLRETNAEIYDDWVAHVKTALSSVKSIDVKVRDEDRHAYFEVTYQSGLKVASSSLSEGTLRILSLSALPYLLSPPGLVAIEQPEDGIHPQAVEAVLEAFKMHYDGQVWLSTHSPVVLAHTELSQILAMRLKNGSVEVVRGNEHPRLKEWQGGLNPGELFAAGILS